MKNKEKYAKEIVDAVTSGGYGFGFNKYSEEIKRCNEVSCDECLFGELSGTYECNKVKREWAESEYVKKPVISKMDRAFLDYINANWHYIARDLNDDLYVYIREPFKVIDCWESAGCEINRSLQMIDINFPMVKWSDKKPWLIEDLKNLEVVDSYE